LHFGMKVKYYKGAMVGGALGALIWVAMGVVGLPIFLSYMVPLFIVKPIVQLFELGSIGALATMFAVFVITFAIYGVLINMLFSKLRSLRS